MEELRAQGVRIGTLDLRIAAKKSLPVQISPRVENRKAQKLNEISVFENIRRFGV